MKEIILGLSAMYSISSFATEISETRCLINYSASRDMIVLTNVIEGSEVAIQEVNCLDLAKRAKNSMVGGKQVSGVEVVYKNPIK